jgi:hypothetical protein
MIDVRCSCGAVYHAHEDFIGRSLQCNNPACRKILRIERQVIEPFNEAPSLLQEVVREQALGEQKTVRASQYEHTRRDRRIGIGIIAVALISVFAWLLLRNPSPETSSPVTEPPPPPNLEATSTPKPELAATVGTTPRLTPLAHADPAEEKEREIAEQDASRPGDPELNMDYQKVNERHFGNRLPAIPVLWEPRLREIGPLKAEGFTEDGLWTALGGKAFILLNPRISRNAAETRRTLCHEMIHEYLFTIGDTKTHHGPAFQSELRRLLAECPRRWIRAAVLPV